MKSMPAVWSWKRKMVSMVTPDDHRESPFLFYHGEFHGLCKMAKPRRF